MSPTILWLVAGALFIALEIFGMPGIGFLFAGIGALVVGALIEFGAIGADAVALQFVIFFAFACVSAVLIWKKLKNNTVPVYSNMVGTEAIVASPGLSGGSEGQVQWSGTLMRARLAPDAGVDVLSEGTYVTIKAIEGTLLLVAPKR